MTQMVSVGRAAALRKGCECFRSLSPDCAPKRTSASAIGTLRKLTADPDLSPFANYHVIVCYGGAGLLDKHLASTIHCVDDEIMGCSGLSNAGAPAL